VNPEALVAKVAFPCEKDFLEFTQEGNLIPVYREILGDLETPVSAYFKVAKDARYAFLLESMEGEEKIARYSFLATDPEMVIQSRGSQVSITKLGKATPQVETYQVADSPLSLVRDILAQYQLVKIQGLPRFCGGIVGYVGYDMVRFFERLPNRPKDDLQMADMLLVLAKTLVIFDHLNHNIKVVHCVSVEPKASLKAKKEAYQAALQQIDKIVAKIHQPLTMNETQAAMISQKLEIDSNLTQEEFCNIVNAAKRQIRAGEIIQVVLSQRLSVPIKTQPFNIYRMLRALNPSPYMYFLNFDDVQIIGSSPELLVRCEDRVVETRPIAGTRRRGKDEKEDQKLAEDLLNDPKERAEHIMLVDLGRNDLGRVCKKGSVYLSEFMVVERYSHVMHIVSNVRGTLGRGKDAFDVLQAAFPAGTVSGAPKIRAMEIIDTHENVARGPYAGCIGYFSFSGNLDSCITIRTIVVKEGRAYIQAGAGIVADSKPELEYQETMNKARAQILAIEAAHQPFDGNGKEERSK
jgi:anthranilate synthase component 1